MRVRSAERADRAGRTGVDEVGVGARKTESWVHARGGETRRYGESDDGERAGVTDAMHDASAHVDRPGHRCAHDETQASGEGLIRRGDRRLNEVCLDSRSYGQIAQIASEPTVGHRVERHERDEGGAQMAQRRVKVGGSDDA